MTAMEEALDFADSLNDFAVSLHYIPGYKHIIKGNQNGEKIVYIHIHL